jgi:group I intron endonuclease
MKHKKNYKSKLKTILNFRYTGIKAGIYQIKCISTGECYIGSTNNLERRCSTHFLALAENRHQNKNLQDRYNVFGSQGLVFIRLLELNKKVSRERLYDQEQKYINECNSVLNIQKTVVRTKFKSSRRKRYTQPVVEKSKVKSVEKEPEPVSDYSAVLSIVLDAVKAHKSVKHKISPSKSQKLKELNKEFALVNERRRNRA